MYALLDAYGEEVSVHSTKEGADYTNDNKHGGVFEVTYIALMEDAA